VTRRLLLHIGMMKSGTTYVQNVCNHNADALGDSGPLWLLGASGRQGRAYLDFRGSKRLPRRDKGIWERLRREVAEHGGDALFSHELVAALGEDRIESFVRDLEADEHHLVITVRDLSRVVPSRWQEQTQNRSTYRWKDYVDALCADVDNPVQRAFWRHADVGRVLRDWSRVVPPERISVITVPPARAGRDELWRRFASVTGADPALAESTAVFDNTSLGPVSSELMIRMNTRVEDLAWNVYQAGFKSGMAKGALAGRASREPRVTFPAERWEWVERHTKRIIDEIEDVGPVVVGDLRDLVSTPPDERGEEAWQPSDAELLDAALDALEGMGRRLGQARVRGAAKAARRSTQPSSSQHPRARGLARAVKRRLRSSGS
jgi:hypothetical protein